MGWRWGRNGKSGKLTIFIDAKIRISKQELLGYRNESGRIITKRRRVIWDGFCFRHFRDANEIFQYCESLPRKGQIWAANWMELRLICTKSNCEAENYGSDSKMMWRKIVKSACKHSVVFPQQALKSNGRIRWTRTSPPSDGVHFKVNAKFGPMYIWHESHVKCCSGLLPRVANEPNPSFLLLPCQKVKPAMNADDCTKFRCESK